MSENEANSGTLQVGQVIKPNVSEVSVREIVHRLYGLDVLSVKELNSYDDRNYFVRVKPEHTNPNIQEIHPHGYVLKVLNSMDSKKHAYIEAMHELIIHVGNQGIATSLPVPSVRGKLMHEEEIPVPEDHQGEGKPATSSHVVRLFSFIPGRILVEVPYTPDLCYKVGKYIGHLDKKMKSFSNPFYDTHDTVWNIGNLPRLKEFLYAVKDESDRKMVEAIIEIFKEKVIPQYEHFQKGMIHGDTNEQNILVCPVTSDGQSPDGNDTYDVCGIIDFGDATYSYSVFEASLVVCYMMVDSNIVAPLDVGGHVLAGYISEMPLAEKELDVMHICVCGRFCQSLVMGAYTYSLDPSNDYVVTTAEKGWPRLRKFWQTPSDEVKSRWNGIIATYNN